MSTLTEQSADGEGLSSTVDVNNEPVNVPKAGVKRKINVKSIETKYRAILAVEKGDFSKSEIARQFEIPSNTLSTWLKSKERIKTMYRDSAINPNRKRMRIGKYEDTETALFEWFTSLRNQNIPVSGPMLKARAEELAKHSGDSDFKCSSGWLDRFKDRHAIRFRRIAGNVKSLDIHLYNESVETFVGPPVIEDGTIQEMKIEQDIKDDSNQNNIKIEQDCDDDNSPINMHMMSDTEDSLRCPVSGPTLEAAMDACITLQTYFQTNGISSQIIHGLLGLPDKVLKELIIHRLQQRSGVSDFFSVFVCVKDLDQ